MSRYQFTPQAADDLFEIWSYIAPDNVRATNRLEAAIHNACAFLADGPLRGRTREDITQLPLRFWTVQAFLNYIIV
jgi:plasmid stabilization system protein ParE